MHKGLREPHLFNAGPNPVKLIQNIAYLLGDGEIQKLRDEIRSNVVSLFRLGVSHQEFACSIESGEWRQRISRLYYGAYNIRRAVTLSHNGMFSTDSTDHKNVDQLPPGINNSAQHRQTLSLLREDRNLSDYNHLASQADLAMTVDDYQRLVAGFHDDCKQFLISAGVAL